MSTYGWMITGVNDSDCRTDLCTMGPSDVPESLREILRTQKLPCVLWRCFTDDAELVYMGVLLEMENDRALSLDEMSATALASPLDNFCMPNYGCTRIQHIDEESRTWKNIIG